MFDLDLSRIEWSFVVFWIAWVLALPFLLFLPLPYWWSGVWLILGLVVELVSLPWGIPLSTVMSWLADAGKRRRRWWKDSRGLVMTIALILGALVLRTASSWYEPWDSILTGILATIAFFGWLVFHWTD